MAKRRRARKKRVEADLDIVIPVYGQGDKLRECLRCIKQAEIGARYQLILVDDKSPEPTIPPDDELPDGTKVIYNEHNSGFPYTANRGARAGRAPLILFLNSDCFLEPNAIAEMMKPFSDEKVGIVGPKLVFPPNSPFTTSQYVPWLDDMDLDRSNLIQHAGIFFGWSGPEHIRLHWNGDHPKVNIQAYVQAVTGACMMTRRKTWDAVRKLWPPEDPSDGGFNLIYGRGCYEDVEYCVLAGALGYRTVYQPTAQGLHHAGASIRGADMSYDLDGNRQMFFLRASKFAMILREGRPLFLYDAFMHF